MQNNSINSQTDIANVTVVTEENQIIVPQPITSVIEVNNPGPQGPVGPQGVAGPSEPFANVGGGVYATTSSIQVSGSFLVSGSSTFTNIGPAIFSGSANIVGATTMSSAIVTGNVTVLGTASIGTLVVNQTVLSTGSNQLGDSANDIQTLYGSVIVPTGSLVVSGSISSLSTNAFAYNRIETTANGGSLGVGVEFKNGLNTTTIGANTTRTYIYSGQGSTENFTILHSNGNVGIGTTAPATALDVVGYARTSQGYKFSQSTNGQFTISSGNTFFDYEGGFSFRSLPTYNTTMYVSASSVGIGTTSPTFRLEVQGGDVRFANALTIGTGGGTGFQFSSNTITSFQNTFFGVDIVGSNRHFNITDTSFSTYYFRVAPTTGNILIGTSVDAGAKLYISGSTSQALLIASSSAGTALYVSGSGRVGVGTNTPAYPLDVNGTIRSQGQLIVVGQIQNPTIGVVDVNGVLYSGTGVSIGVNSTNAAKLLVRGSGATSATTALRVENTNASASLVVLDNGNVGINTGSADYNLDVNGTIRVGGFSYFTAYFTAVQRLQFNNGSVATNWGQFRGQANGVFRLVDSSEADFNRLQFGGGTTLFPALQRVSASIAVVDATGGNSGSLLINTTSSAGYALDVNGTARVQNISYIGPSQLRPFGSSIAVDPTGGNLAIIPSNTTNTLVDSTGAVFIRSNTIGTTANLFTLCSIQTVFSPTSGTGVNNNLVIHPIINQTGGANGITRGLYINPTLTAAADWRAIEVASGASILNGVVAINSTNISTGYALFVNGVIGASSLTLTQNLTMGENFAISNNGSQTIDIDANNNTTDAVFRVTANGTANELFRVNESGSFGIGTIAPTNTLDVSGTVRLLSGGSYLTLNNSTYSELAYTAVNYFRANGASALINGPIIQFLVGGSEKVRVASTTGNFLINTTTDAGFKLDVNGNAKIKGSGATSATTSLRVENTNTSASLVVLDDGNVGIGTAAPVAPLVVQTNSSGLGINIKQRTGNDFANFLFTNTSDTTLGGVGYVTTSRIRFMTGGVGDAFERLSIFHSTGNVGINTTTDNGYRLQVNATGSNSGSLFISGASNTALLRIDSPTVNNILYVSGSGNVGVGTATPGYALEIANTGLYYAGASQTAQLLITTSGSVGSKEGSFIAAGALGDRTLQLGIADNSSTPVGIDMFETNNTFGSTYLNFRVNNANLVRMTGSFVGIGTTSPAYALDLYGTYHQYQAQGEIARYDISSANADQNRGVWNFYTNAAASADFFGRFGFKFEGGTADSFKQFQVHVADSTTPKFVVNGSGNVGIGTITPAYKLDASGSARFKFTPSGADLFTIDGATTTRYFIVENSNGFVGIGNGYTTSATPATSVDIRGNTSIRGGSSTVGNAFIVTNTTPTTLLTIQNNGQVSFTSPTMSLAASQSAFSISPIISASNVIGGQYYGVNITPTFFQTTGSQTETAFRVAATFTASNAAAATGGNNVIADFGSTSAGSQLTVTDVTSGSIYMVNDVSGIPIIEATSNWDVNIYDFPNKVFEKTGSQVNIYGTMRISGSFILPLSQSVAPQTGSAYWSGSLLFIYNGTRYMSSSFA